MQNIDIIKVIRRPSLLKSLPNIYLSFKTVQITEHNKTLAETVSKDQHII